MSESIVTVNVSRWNAMQDEMKSLRTNAFTAAARLLEIDAERDAVRAAYMQTSNAVEQALGKALGYPWYKDDPANFPNATEADGVCTGEHTAESIAMEAANRIVSLRAAALRARKALGLVESEQYDHGEERACAWCRKVYLEVYDGDYKLIEDYQPHKPDCPRQLALAALDAALGEKST